LKSIEWIERVVKEEDIECHFHSVDGHLFLHEESDEAYAKLKTVEALIISQVFLQFMSTISLEGCV